jgi:hypothetical protein
MKGRAPPGEGLFPEIVDASHATAKAAAFFHSYFDAKSRHDVDATMDHFSSTTLTYMDATLGWAALTHEALTAVFGEFMPAWPPSALSYPTRILGNEVSALVAYTDTPELFGGEIRTLAAIDIDDGKIVRWVDYWDGRHFGARQVASPRTPADRFPTDFNDGAAAGSSSALIREVAGRLHSVLASDDSGSAASLFSSEGVSRA